MMKEDATTTKPIVTTPNLRKRFTGISIVENRSLGADRRPGEGNSRDGVIVVQCGPRLFWVWSNECSEPPHTDAYCPADIDIPGNFWGPGGINGGLIRVWNPGGQFKQIYAR